MRKTFGEVVNVISFITSGLSFGGLFVGLVLFSNQKPIIPIVIIGISLIAGIISTSLYSNGYYKDITVSDIKDIDDKYSPCNTIVIDSHDKEYSCSLLVRDKIIIGGRYKVKIVGLDYIVEVL